MDNRDNNGDLVDYSPGNGSEDEENDELFEDLSENSENFDADSEESAENEESDLEKSGFPNVFFDFSRVFLRTPAKPPEKAEKMRISVENLKNRLFLSEISKKSQHLREKPAIFSKTPPKSSYFLKVLVKNQ